MEGWWDIRRLFQPLQTATLTRDKHGSKQARAEHATEMHTHAQQSIRIEEFRTKSLLRYDNEFSVHRALASEYKFYNR